MGTQDIQPRVGLFGFNKEEVEEYLEEIRSYNQGKLEIIKHKIEAVRKENQQLTMELERLNATKQTEMESKDFMEFATAMAEKFVPVMNHSAKSEVSRITQLYKEQEAVFNTKIEEFDRTIKATQAQLNALLGNVLEKNENIDRNLKSFIDGEDASRGVIINKNDSQNIVHSPKISDSPKEEKNLKKVPDWESYIEQINNSSRVKNEDTNINKNAVREKEREESSKQSRCETGPLMEVRESKNTIGKPALKNQEIESEIDQFRNKYLIGKILGADLLDRNSRVIVPKNTVITPEVVEKADREGKLAELIVNMIMPEVKE